MIRDFKAKNANLWEEAHILNKLDQMNTAPAERRSKKEVIHIRL